MLLKTFIKLYKKPLILASGLVLGTVLFIFISEQCKHHQEEHMKSKVITDCDRSLYATAPIAPTRKLKDQNDLQLLHAQANGLKNVYISNASFEADSARLAKEQILIHLHDNPSYRVKEMTHSYPYTTPEMGDLLNDINFLFQEKMKDTKQDKYLFRVTSGLRTNETQQDLTSRNSNASTQSAHLFGATLDVSYKEFYNVTKDTIEANFYAAEALRETMEDLREQCRMVIVRERRQACYHFTVVVCAPTNSADAVKTN